MDKIGRTVFGGVPIKQSIIGENTGLIRESELSGGVVRRLLDI